MRVFRSFGLLLSAILLAGSACEQARSDRSKFAIERQTPKITTTLQNQGQKVGAPVFIRIIKSVDGSLSDGYLELFLADESGAFQIYKSWPICTYSGTLGPKLKEGDGQSPEGFYFVTPGQMNPNSSYHLSFNLGFPNAYDRAHGRTGSFLMVHGNCVSIGCYAMTDPVIEEIYTIMSSSFDEGQPFIRVHIFPFQMTEENLAKVVDNRNVEFWLNLKEGWDHFEHYKRPPGVSVENRAYVFSH